MFADGIFVGPESRRHRLADQGDGWGSGAVGFAEVAALQQAGAQGAQIAGADAAHGNFRLHGEDFRGSAFDDYGLDGSSDKRQAVDGGGGYDAGQNTHALQNVVEEFGLLGWLLILHRRNGHGHGQN